MNIKPFLVDSKNRTTTLYNLSQKYSCSLNIFVNLLTRENLSVNITKKVIKKLFYKRKVVCLSFGLQRHEKKSEVEFCEKIRIKSGKVQDFINRI